MVVALMFAMSRLCNLHFYAVIYAGKLGITITIVHLYVFMAVGQIIFSILALLPHLLFLWYFHKKKRLLTTPQIKKRCLQFLLSSGVVVFLLFYSFIWPLLIFGPPSILRTIIVQILIYVSPFLLGMYFLYIDKMNNIFAHRY